jgi:hypothetical protein
MDSSTLWLATCFVLFTVYKNISSKYHELTSNTIYRIGFIPIIALPSLILDSVVTGSLANYILVGAMFIYMLMSATQTISKK